MVASLLEVSCGLSSIPHDALFFGGIFALQYCSTCLWASPLRFSCECRLGSRALKAPTRTSPLHLKKQKKCTLAWAGLLETGLNIKREVLRYNNNPLPLSLDQSYHGVHAQVIRSAVSKLSRYLGRSYRVFIKKSLGQIYYGVSYQSYHVCGV